MIIRTLKLLEKKKWRQLQSLGCYFFVDPTLDSESINIFWSKTIKPIVLNCTTYASNSNDECFVIRLDKLRCRRDFVTIFNGKFHLSLTNENGSIQLIFNEKVGLDKPINFTVSISSSSKILKQMEAIEILTNIINEVKISVEKIHSQSPKFANPEILFAYDFIKSGNSQRELARNLFGNEAIINDWDGISDSLRAKTRRLIAQGKMFVNKSVIDFF